MVRLLTPLDMTVELPDGNTEVSDVEEGCLQRPQGPLLGEDFSTVLNKRTKLRKKLLRADYYKSFLHKCRSDDIMLKGLRLSQQVHPTSQQ